MRKETAQKFKATTKVTVRLGMATAVQSEQVAAFAAINHSHQVARISIESAKFEPTEIKVTYWICAFGQADAEDILRDYYQKLNDRGELPAAVFSWRIKTALVD